MARVARSAATAARPTCAPTCSSLTEAGATSAASAAVSTKVKTGQERVARLKMSPVKSICFPFSSSGLLFPTSGPHGPEGRLLRETRTVSGLLRVCRNPGLLQGNEFWRSPACSEPSLQERWRVRVRGGAESLLWPTHALFMKCYKQPLMATY